MNQQTQPQVQTNLQHPNRRKTDRQPEPYKPPKTVEDYMRLYPINNIDDVE